MLPPRIPPDEPWLLPVSPPVLEEWFEALGLNRSEAWPWVGAWDMALMVSAVYDGE